MVIVWQIVFMESFEMVDGVTNLDKLSASALFFPGLFAISKSKAPTAANHLCPVASKFAVVNTYVSGLLSVKTLKVFPKKIVFKFVAYGPFHCQKFQFKSWIILF
jgi:hypothetical protein